MSGQAEQRRDHAAVPETTETRLRDVFEAYEKLEQERRQHIEQLRLAGWLKVRGEFQLAAGPAEFEPAEYYEPAEYNEGNINPRYLLR